LAPTVGIATTGFCHPGGILQLFHREDQQILRLPTAVARSLQQIASYRIIFISEININYRLHHRDLQRFAVKNRQVPSKLTDCGTSRKIDLHRSNSNPIRITKFQAMDEYANSYLLKLHHGN
jgi:hypothetical protein